VVRLIVEHQTEKESYVDKRRSRVLLCVGAAACLIAGGALSGSLGIAGAASSSSTTPSATFKSNEDPAHEATESAAREAAEDNGTAGPFGDHRGHRDFGGPGDHGGPGPGHFNEDPAHEAAESPAREAQEDGTQGGSTTTTPAPAAGSTN
jgi:hypothetical protein